MKVKRLGNVEYGSKVEIGGDIFLVCDLGEIENCWAEMKLVKLTSPRGFLIPFTSDTKANLHWWEALKNPTKIEVMEAYEDGAPIQYKERMSMEWKNIIKKCKPTWNWYKVDYRIKPKTYKIDIDGKEIELSEESYKKLKESLV